MAPKQSCEVYSFSPSSPETTLTICTVSTRRRRCKKTKQRSYDKSYNSASDPKEDMISEKVKLALNLKLKIDENETMKYLLAIEVQQNNELGRKVHELVKQLCNEREQEKYNVFVEDLDKITKLLLSLATRLAQVEYAIKMLGSNARKEDLTILCQKRNKLSEQYNDAKDIEDNMNKRQKALSKILTSTFTEKQFASFERHIRRKTALIVEQHDFDNHIKLGEIQIQCLCDSLPEKWQMKLATMLNE